MEIDQAYYNAVDLLQELIAIPSYSREENAAADLLFEKMMQYGISPQRDGNNIWAIAPYLDPTRPTLMLNSHIDTVKPVAGWKRDAHTPIIEDGKLYGLGSNDAGASLVSLLFSFILLREKKEPFNLIFLASCQEEVSGADGIERALKQLPPIDFAIVGEPTQMHPAIAEKGLIVLDCLVEGVAGHAARNEGINAIYKALPIIAALQNYQFEKQSPLLGSVKLTVTQINSGTQHNVIPDRCNFVVDVRSTDCYTNEEIVKELQQHFIDCTITPRRLRLGSSGVNENHPLVQRALLMGYKPFGSPTLSDQALLTCPSIKIGPGASQRSHTADEYIALDEIREAIELYTKLIDGVKINILK